MITIVDYGMGNVRSVSKALEHLGLPVRLTSAPEEIATAGHLILPGVGAFGDAMAELGRRGLVEPLKAHIAAGKPFLGICVGLQVLMESSEESPGVPGLGVFGGPVRRFRTTRFKVPHMGWNNVHQVRPAPLFKGLPDAEYFYFVHSYYPAPEDPAVVAGVAEYDGEFACVLWRGNVAATQFHPEKSQSAGLALLSNFAAWSCGDVAALEPRPAEPALAE